MPCLTDPTQMSEQFICWWEVEEEVQDPIDEESDPEEDNVEKRTEKTNSEQEGDSEEECAERPLKVSRMSAFLGKDRRATWNKHNIPNKEIRNRKCNIVTPLPGGRPSAKNAKTEYECWNLFFCDEIFEVRVENTNRKIQSQRDTFFRPRDAKSTDLVEIKALLGLFYLTGVLQSNRLNVDFWEKNSTGVEKFWLTMSKGRFLFLLRFLCFDDKITRNERSEDKLAPIRQLFDSCVANCKKCYTISLFATIDEQLPAFKVGAHSGNTSLQHPTSMEQKFSPWLTQKYYISRTWKCTLENNLKRVFPFQIILQVSC
ncbi:hypothetical protein ILUMI_17908 [Ignelater luminosus]|uniref:PiggyBac transposable element-derived protein domain-containing protein n=1 Tax=Ignelater luminosus TaxID=2038154 RepID=A0A8K0CRC4_IGNLU|nr:hypothetical protein ILUMI_17908 [Ignelater luminosus]